MSLSEPFCCDRCLLCLEAVLIRAVCGPWNQNKELKEVKMPHRAEGSWTVIIFDDNSLYSHYTFIHSIQWLGKDYINCNLRYLFWKYSNRLLRYWNLVWNDTYSRVDSIKAIWLVPLPWLILVLEIIARHKGKPCLKGQTGKQKRKQ